MVSARQAAVRWAAEKKGEPVSEDALNFARAKCFSSPVIIIVSMVGDDKKIVDQENYAACWCAIENLLLAATARGLGSYPSTGDWIDQNFVGPVLGLTEKERPVACIFLGYSEQKTMAKRLPVERHERFLRQILGLLGVANNPGQHPIDRRVVTQKQLVKGCAIARTQPLKQGCIGVSHRVISGY